MITSATRNQPMTTLPMLAGGYQIPTNPLVTPGMTGAQQLRRPSLPERLVLAAKAAIAELGMGPGSQSAAAMALQSATSRSAITSGPVRRRRVAAKRTRVRNGRPSLARAAATRRTAGAQSAGLPQGMPIGMTLPGGQVIPLGANAAGLQGLQGLPPQMQAQLGMLPGWIDGMEGYVEQPSGPQVNATNQSGMSTGGLGSGDAATQSVTNRNTVDTLSRSVGSGSPWGWSGGLDAGLGAMGSPYGYYGPSMTGIAAGTLGEPRPGILQRLFGW